MTVIASPTDFNWSYSWDITGTWRDATAGCTVTKATNSYNYPMDNDEHFLVDDDVDLVLNSVWSTIITTTFSNGDVETSEPFNVIWGNPCSLGFTSLPSLPSETSVRFEETEALSLSLAIHS